jgi:hypothetical protein
LANIRIGESRSNLSSDLEICERYAQIIYGFITFHSITRIKYSADSFELVKREIFTRGSMMTQSNGLSQIVRIYSGQQAEQGFQISRLYNSLALLLLFFNANWMNP